MFLEPEFKKGKLPELGTAQGSQVSFRLGK
jgi:hypothetical protein